MGGATLDDIRGLLHAYTDAWNSAFETKSDLHIRQYMSKSFRGVWGHSGIEKPEEYGYDYDIVGVLKQYDNAKKSFDPIDVSERNNGAEIIVFGTETNVINGKTFQAKALLIWRNQGGKWKLLREYIELTR